MTEHKAEAEAHIEAAIDAWRNGHWQTAQFEVKLAQVEATLALSEQNRIGNVIAAHGYWGADALAVPENIRRGLGIQ